MICPTAGRTAFLCCGVRGMTCLHRDNRDNRGEGRLYWSKRYPGKERATGTTGTSRVFCPGYEDDRDEPGQNYPSVFIRIPVTPVVPVK